jgi:hypothetical protein
MLKIIASLCDVAEGQAGLVTEHQAAAYGATPDVLHALLEHRVIETVLPEVIRVRGGARPPFPRLYAHWLLLAPEQPAWERPLPAAGVVSHGAAARVYGVGNLPGPTAEFTVPADHPVTAAPDVALHRAVVRPDEYRDIAGMPVTSPARTFADIATARSTDLEGLGRIATNFLRQGLATRDELAQALAAAETTDAAGHADSVDSLLASVDGAESLPAPEEEA